MDVLDARGSGPYHGSQICCADGGSEIGQRTQPIQPYDVVISFVIREFARGNRGLVFLRTGDGGGVSMNCSHHPSRSGSKSKGKFTAMRQGTRDCQEGEITNCCQEVLPLSMCRAHALSATLRRKVIEHQIIVDSCCGMWWSKPSRPGRSPP